MRQYRRLLSLPVMETPGNELASSEAMAVGAVLN